MKLKRNTLILVIFAFLLIVNLLIIFNFNYFYIQTILTFIFLITIPGFLTMLFLKIKAGFWKCLLYTVGLSVAFIMFAGLFVNWTLPLFKIDNPLSLYPVLVTFDVLLLLFLSIASWRNKDMIFKIKFPEFSWVEEVFIVIPMIFPVLGILGALILNNHGPNYLSIALLAFIAIYILLVVILRNKLGENVYFWGILMISISLLLTVWLRSWYVSGIDINQEYSFFQITKNLSYWDPTNFIHNYNSMLSVTIFPTVLSLLLNINDQYIFKLVIPLIFSFTPIVVYLLSRKYLQESLAFLAAFFFIAQPVITMGGLGLPIRQKVAFLFFSLMLLALFDDEINSALKSTLFIIFGFSMIVSHYSTTYLALAFFLIIYVISFFYRILEKLKMKKGKLGASKKQKFNLKILLIVLLLIFTFFWYWHLTKTAQGLVDFTERSFSNIGNIFKEEVQLEGQSVIEQLNIFQSPEISSLTLSEYANQIVNDYKEKYPSPNFYEGEKYDYSVNAKAAERLPSRYDERIVSSVYSLRDIFKNLGKLTIIIGVIYLLITRFREKNPDREYLITIIASIAVLSIMIFLPFTSINYDLGRTYQQTLVTLSMTSVLGCFFVFKFLKKNHQFFMIALFFIFYFLFLSRGVQQIVGGSSDVSMAFNNMGFEYETIYTHKAEILSGNFLFDTYDQESAIYIDNFAYEKILLLMPPELSNRIVRTLFIPVMRTDAYVYSSYSNYFNKIIFKPHQRITLSYNYPQKFLEDNKNKIYDNGGSEIFR